MEYEPAPKKVDGPKGQQLLIIHIDLKRFHDSYRKVAGRVCWGGKGKGFLPLDKSSWRPFNNIYLVSVLSSNIF